MLDQPYMTDLIEANSMGHKPQNIHIYSASWGPTDDGKTVDGPRNATMRAIVRGVNQVTNIHRVPKKTKQICFCQNFVKFPRISIIFGRKMGNDPNICKVHSFSTSPNLCHHLTVLNANVPNCYITPKLLVIDRSN